MQVATFAPRPLHPQGKLSGTHQVIGWTRPRASLCVWKINLLALTGVEPRLPRRPDRSLFTTPTALSRSPIYMLFTPKRMWMKPSQFLLPCRPQTTPRATKRTIHSRRLWNGYTHIEHARCEWPHVWVNIHYMTATTFGFIKVPLSTTCASNLRENIPKPTAYLKTKSSFILLLQHCDEIIHCVWAAAGVIRGGRGSLHKQEACMGSVRTTSVCRPLPVIRNGHILFQIPTQYTCSPKDGGRIFLLKRGNKSQ